MTAGTADSATEATVVERLDAWLSDRPWVRLVAATVGVASLTAAVLLVTGIGGERAETAITSVLRPSRAVLFVVALGSGVVAIGSLLRGRREDGRRCGLPAPPDQTVDEDSVVGATFDDSLERGIDSVHYTTGWGAVGVEDELRSLAITVLRRDGGYSVDGAAAALESGRWSEDPRAATYLGIDNHCSLRMRIRDWLSGEADTRQVEATLAELAAIAGVEIEPADAPESESNRHRVSPRRSASADGMDEVSTSTGSPTGDSGPGYVGTSTAREEVSER